MKQVLGLNLKMNHDHIRFDTVSDMLVVGLCMAVLPTCRCRPSWTGRLSRGRQETYGPWHCEGTNLFLLLVICVHVCFAFISGTVVGELTH